MLLKENNVKALHSFELPSIKEASDETIFNPTNFLEIYNRAVDIKSNAQRQWGKMNLVQMLNHLKIATGSGINIYKLKREGSWLWRTIIKFIVIWILRRLPKNAKAAEGFKIEMNRPLDFNTEKVELLNVLKKAYASTSDFYPHPMFGKMSREEWGRLVYRHFDHHFRQFSS